MRWLDTLKALLPGSLPATPPEAVAFVPNKTFFEPKTRSEYVQGLRYSARTDELKALVKTWLSDGRVQLAIGPAAKIHGR